VAVSIAGGEALPESVSRLWEVILVGDGIARGQKKPCWDASWDD
jgi:hypothetical protein